MVQTLPSHGGSQGRRLSESVSAGWKNGEMGCRMPHVLVHPLQRGVIIPALKDCELEDILGYRVRPDSKLKMW